MQRDMDRFDSPDVSRISPSLPPSETVRGNPTTPRLRTNSAASSFARPTEASRRHSTGLQHSSSRSNLKASTTKDAKVPASPRAPKPLPKSPAAHRHSYHELLGRKASTSSLRSDASTNSLASSVASRSPRQSPTSPRRVRTLSTPARPSEPQLRASSSKPNSQKGSVSSHPRSPPNDEERDSNGSSRPVRQGGHSPSPAFNRSQSMQSSMQLTQPIARQRHNSTSSLASSISSHSHDDSEEEEEEVHERERNWNNPHPKWTHHSPRAPSPLPRSRPSSPLPMSLPSATPAKSTLSHPTERTRHDSLIVPGSPSVSSSSRTARRSPSPQPGTSRLPRANNTKGQSPKSPNVTPHLGKRANQTVDSSRTIDLSTISPERPKMSRPTSLHGSHLPMRASTVTHPPPHPAGASRSPNSHSRSQSVPSIVVDEHASGTDDLFTTSDAATPPSIQRVLPLSPSPSTDADEPDSAPPILRRSTTPDISLKHTRETSDESRLQRSLRSPPSPPPSPPTETRNGSNSSILVTPPRKTALSSPPHLEYKTPSPPKNLPELPGPPSSDDDTGPLPPSPTFRTPARALLSGNQSTFKTPAPPGAWSATPLPSLKDKLIPHQEIEPDPSQRSPGFSGEQNFSFPNYPKTPKPPGGWQDTPAIPPRTLNMPMLEDDDSAVDSGLATPAPSLGRSSGLPFATPAPPGAYAVTPTPRKSILKVRFEEEAPTSDPASTDAEEGKQELDSFPSFSLPSPTSPSRGHKRATSVRLLDSSGQSKVDDDVPSQPQRPQSHKRNVTTVRIVDSMGREIEPSPLLDLSVVKDEAENSVELSSEESIALTRDEALARVKRGLSDLTVGLQELEGTHSFSSDDPQLRKLKDISETARQAQDGLKATLSTKNNGKLSSLKRKLSNVLWPGSSRSALVIASVFHVILFYFLLRLLTTSAHKYFLTTYYDPFYPDIHMYTSIPTPQRQTPLFRAALIGGDWKTMAGSFWETLALTFLHYQQDMWERWGHNSAQNMLWPPE
ncbi:hypothetical protein DL96DRAFT_1497834 [Flagelloscypha sp. PMI_526]|nr:hypothetical protein DL96DRAFT_1497834 [Flagelloscypha sp. PMI_526]